MEDGSSKNVAVNEATLLGEPWATGVMTSECGLLLGQQKYVIVTYNEGTQSLYLKKPNGGGTICKTNQCYLVGLWEQAGNQSAGNCNRDVEDLAQKLKAAGY